VLSWSFLDHRPDLWPIGAPLALVGGAAVLIGLILQIDSLGEENRKAAARIALVDQRLAELRTRATTFSPRQDGSKGGSPASDGTTEALLAELKSQLDVLAERMGRPS
jgi:hypothetical protein